MSNSGPGFMTGTSKGNLDLMRSLRRGRDFYGGLVSIKPPCGYLFPSKYPNRFTSTYSWAWCNAVISCELCILRSHSPLNLATSLCTSVSCAFRMASNAARVAWVSSASAWSFSACAAANSCRCFSSIWAIIRLWELSTAISPFSQSA